MTPLPPWVQRSLVRAVDAHAANRLPHALLLGGERGLGKRALADALARRLLCATADGATACGACKPCRLLAAGTHPDRRAITLDTRDDGRQRTEIVIDQIRALSQALSLTAQMGGAVVATLDPADALNVAAANALLKTLEEPQPGRFLLLIADEPFRLPATIRSRCQRLAIEAPSREEARAWLQSLSHEASAVDEALDLADGNPGIAREALDAGLLELKRGVLADLGELARGRAQPFPTARAWLEDRPDWRLRFAADAVRRHGWREALDAGRRARADFATLAAWYDAANRTRELLRSPVRPELALGELLMGWRDAWQA